MKTNGILGQNANTISITRNRVDGLPPSGHSNLKMTGIEMTMSLNAYEQCNHTFNVGRGIVFNSNCANSTVLGNHFDLGTWGLALDNSGFIGDQLPGGIESWNHWMTAPPFLFNTITMGGSSGSIINWAGSSGFPTDPSPTSGVFTLNNVSVATTTDPCSAPPQFAGEFDPDGAKRIASDSLSGSADGDWMNRFKLYWFLLSDSTAAWQSDATLVAFMSAMQNTSAGKLADVKSKMESDSIVEARAMNTQVQDTLLSAINQQTVNDLLLNRYMDSLSLSPIEDVMLLEIANQCPYSGGPAVFDARALWFATHPFDSTRFDDESICSAANRIIEQVEATPIESSDIHLVLSPNPATNYVQLVLWSDSGSECGTIELLDALGRTVRLIRCNRLPFETEISIAELSNGVYHCHFTSASVKSLNENLIVFH